MKTFRYVLILMAALWPAIGWGQNPPLIGPEVPPPPQNPLSDPQGDRALKILFNVSVDLAKQELLNSSAAGTPYANRDAVGTSLRYNAAILLLTGVKQIINNWRDFLNSPHTYRSPTPSNPATLMASTDGVWEPVAPADKDSFLNHLDLAYGLQLIGKGGKMGTSTTRMTYLEVPAYILYNHDLPNGKGQVFGGLGFYLAYGLWGNISDSAFPGSVSAFDKNSGYKHFDAGLLLTTGYQLPQSLRVSLAYELGLVNLVPNGGPYDKVMNRVWSLNVAYPLQNLGAMVKKSKASSLNNQ
ncbi:hypothetical protein FHS68_001523 [Dyadobacter arcticus]|uniref:Outer membrane protein beta-barrel domain-containing protein n=2 Tax=Dyadobacter arcticus TaxID=1078754 RepID=A0ABX0UH71_9BACT|nr:hypothetical protein [Dyadobacter arcticus]